jgi:hypothetical protein
MALSVFGGNSKFFLEPLNGGRLLRTGRGSNFGCNGLICHGGGYTHKSNWLGDKQ